MHHLKIYVDSDQVELKEAYIKAAQEHNLQQSSATPDSGFDLLVPAPLLLQSNAYQPHKIDFQVKCALVTNSLETYSTDRDQYSAYYLYPRSSLSSTPLRLANSVGIIDAGYRGSIKAVFDIRFPDQMGLFHSLSAFTRLVQLCAPDLGFLHVTIVDSMDDLGGPTPRGEGGFGSTG